jgi:hypothetical protein
MGLVEYVNVNEPFFQYVKHARFMFRGSCRELDGRQPVVQIVSGSFDFLYH